MGLCWEMPGTSARRPFWGKNRYPSVSHRGISHVLQRFCVGQPADLPVKGEYIFLNMWG